MKQITIALLTAIFLLTACGQSAPASVPVFEQATSTPTFLPTSTQTSLPSATPTASITPLPTIPTFTPTFDASIIVTVTPATKAECPAVNLNLHTSKFKTTMDVLDFLNQGGSPEIVTESLGETENFTDITGDTIPELIVNLGGLHILGCKNGSYQAILSSDSPSPEAYARIAIIQDMNGDGLPEIVVQSHGIGTIPIITYHVFEWDGQVFRDLIEPVDFTTHYGSIGLSQEGYAFAKGNSQISQSIWDTWTIQDIDSNGTYELILSAGRQTSMDALIHGNWRAESLTLLWNGHDFVPYHQNIESPIFRYQAIQDGDFASLDANYRHAISLYQETISNSQLEWWSQDRFIYNAKLLQSQNGFGEILATPIPDLAEYPRLAAYAYYRIMLLHLVQNQESDVTITYTTLQEKFGNDQYGHPYVEMATAFWDAYRHTHSVYDGCAAAIQYAAEHPEILIPLGSDYHGWQSHTYVPEDVCPFR